MSNILNFPTPEPPTPRLRSGQARPGQASRLQAGENVTTKGIHVVRIHNMCLAVAYYAGTGDPDTAQKILKYIDVYKLYNNYCHVTEEIELLMKGVDFGMACLGNFPTEEKK
jgi:hypothetical protein